MRPNQDALLTLLAELRQTDQECFDIQKYEEWLKKIISPPYMASKDRATRWATAAVLAEFLGKCSPSPPWNEDELRTVFELFISILDESAKPPRAAACRSDDSIVADDSDLISTVETVFEELSLTGAHVLLQKIDNNKELLESLFEAAFRALQAWKSQELLRHLQAVLVDIVSSGQFRLGGTVVALILDNLRGPTPLLSVQLAEFLGPQISEYFESLLAANTRQRFVRATDSAISILRWCPAVIEPFIGLFSDHLSSESPAARLMAVKVVGAALNVLNIDRSRWIERANDKLPAIRLAWVDACTSADLPDEQVKELEDRAEDSVASIRAAACRAPYFSNHVKAAKKVLVPRFRDLDEDVRSKAFESARQLYDVHWRSSEVAWVPNTIFCALYTDLSLSLRLWLEAADLFGGCEQTAFRVVTTVAYCTPKALKAFDRLYKAHISAAEAVSMFMAGKHTEITGSWLDKIRPGIDKELQALNDEDRMVLLDAAAPTSSLDIIYAQSQALPVPLQSLALCASYRMEDAMPGILDLLTDENLRVTALYVAELIAASLPQFISQNTAKLVELIVSEPGSAQLEAAVKILALAAERLAITLPASVLDRVESMHSGDSIRLLAKCSPERLDAVAVDLVNGVLAAPSVAGLEAVEALRHSAPNAAPAIEKTLPKRLFKLVHDRKNAPDVRSAALNALLAKVLVLDRHDERAVWVAKPIIAFLESILRDGTNRPEAQAGDQTREGEGEGEEKQVLDTAARLWIRLAARFPKGMEYRIHLLVPRMTPKLAADIVNTLKERRLSFEFAVLLFLPASEDVQRVVKVAVPMLLQCKREALLTCLARLIHYLATSNSPLPYILATLRYFQEMVCSADTFGMLYRVACRVKQYRDARDAPAPATGHVSISSERMYAISELALQMLDVYRGAADWPLDDDLSDQRLLLPASLFQGMPTPEYAQHIAEQRFITLLGPQEELDMAVGSANASPGKSPRAPARPQRTPGRPHKPNGAPSPTPLVSRSGSKPYAGTTQNRMKRGLEPAALTGEPVTPDVGSPRPRKRRVTANLVSDKVSDSATDLNRVTMVDSVAEAPKRARQKRSRVVT